MSTPSTTPSSASSVPLALRRIAQGFPQWDIDYALYQVIWLIRGPRQVYKLTQHRKQTKNQWSRDDPAFVAVLTVFLTVSAVAYGVGFRVGSVSAFIRLITATLLSFYGGGAAVATACWFIANKYMRLARVPHSVDQSVEWLYAFDIHCNAFVPVFVLLHVVFYILCPLLLSSSFGSVVAANSLVLLAVVAYWYITLSGYMVLPFLQNTHFFLLPVLGTIGGYFLAVMFQWNLAAACTNWYVGSA